MDPDAFGAASTAARTARTTACAGFAILVLAAVGVLVPAASPLAVAATASWDSPTPRRLVVMHPFVAPATAYAAGHRGVDLAASPGDPLVAPTAGTVVFVGAVVDRPVVTLESPDGLLISLEPAAATVKPGDPVRQAQSIGTVGRGGHCDGVCVHLGLRRDGEYLNPMVYLGGVAPAVLLPLDGDRGRG